MTAAASTAIARLQGSPERCITLQKDEFISSYVNSVKSLARTLDGFLETPDERAVHEVRTAIRRLDAHLDLLPGKIRKSPEVEELLRRHKKVMKISTKVRDLDVIRGKVAKYPYWQEFLTERLLKKIDNRQRSLMKEMKERVAAARKFSLPAVESRDLPQEKLQARYLKTVSALTESIDTLLPVAAADPDMVDELRKLRIDSSRLRFTRELAPAAGSAKFLALMEDRQDALGAIHDWDVTIVCLQEFDNPVAEELVLAGVRERVREFRAFARSVLHPA